ncbi:MAG TPA: hypothetical protein VGS03_00315 [Candidatus Polarisedimenticolia bacterium]|jgi:hypothetical protein|nr:hypothetical protein [Candidatus Polarisedimenticolia bacterium]
MTTIKTRTLALPGALVLAAALVGPAAFAGEIYGRVLSGNAAAPAGTTVGAKCAEADYAARPIDAKGSYHIVAGKTGKCTLTITMKGQSATVEVVSYDEPVEADIVLDTKDGKLSARRR